MRQGQREGCLGEGSLWGRSSHVAASRGPTRVSDKLISALTKHVQGDANGSRPRTGTPRPLPATCRLQGTVQKGEQSLEHAPASRTGPSPPATRAPDPCSENPSLRTIHFKTFQENIPSYSSSVPVTLTSNAVLLGGNQQAGHPPGMSPRGTSVRSLQDQGATTAAQAQRPEEGRRHDWRERAARWPGRRRGEGPGGRPPATRHTGTAGTHLSPRLSSHG